MLLVLCSAMAVFALAAASASAVVLYVDARNGADTSKCGRFPAEGPEGPCKTIKYGVERARTIPGPNTLEVAEGPYKESLLLNQAADAHLTIEAEEPNLELNGGASNAISVAAIAKAVTIKNFFLRGSGASSVVHETAAEVTLANDKVELENGENGVEAIKGSLSMTGSTVVMEVGTKGYGVYALEAPATLNGVTILGGGGGGEAEAGGVDSVKSSLSIANSHIAIESGKSTTEFAINAEHDSSTTLTNDVVRQNAPDIGVALAFSPVTVNGLNIEMVNASDNVEGMLIESEEMPQPASSISHLTIGGTWHGWGLLAENDLTLTDSRIVTGPFANGPALKYGASAGAQGLFAQRTLLQTQPGASEAVEVLDANATFDSSAVLGGLIGIKHQTYPFSPHSGPRLLTLSASTVDAGAPGTAADAPNVIGVEARSFNGPGNAANVAIQGSVVLEKQAASTTSGNSASIKCSYSAVPSQLQAEGGGSGSIGCAAGTGGNTEVNPLSSIFATGPASFEPISNYALAPGSSAVDSVPASAVALPSGLVASATDLAGNPRVVDGNGDCVPVQDKGALELQGHSAACVVVPISTPVKALGVISALHISPAAFSAAPKGATISAARKKRSYGAKITWRDSQAASTTFTVLRPSVGRMQGRSCKKPSHANRKGRKCTLYTALGTFGHADAAAGNSLHFSGRLHGRALARGTYRLSAQARDAAGLGPAATASFTIR